jgi:Flp pilus assembly protein TadG
MIRRLNAKSDQRGATLVEFAISATVFLTAMFAVMEFGRVLWTHNALSDAARRATRYAVNQRASTPPGVSTTGTNVGPSLTAIRNVAVYGDPAGGSQPLINDLTTDNVNVQYQQFGLGAGTVAVTITNYRFRFVVPIIGTTIPMPDYQTTLTGESAGVLPSGGS